jgi:hypothetical protein
MFGMNKNIAQEKTKSINGMSIYSIRMLILEYEIDLVHQDIVLIVYVSFYLNATSLLLMPFVVLLYTSIIPNK